MNRRQVVQMVAAALVAALVLGGVASAAPEHGRGNIVSVNWDRLTMQIKHPSGSIGTWRFNRNATVKFIDGAAFFPNPSTKDLREPMYVAYVFDNEVIDSFEVRELGFTPGREETTSTRKEQGTPRSVTGKLTAYDTNVMQIEMEINGVRETFQLVSSVPMRGLAAGQQVRVRTEWSGQQELVHELTILGRR